MKRIYHHYSKWEDYQNGMWHSIYGGKRKVLLKQAIRFISNTKLYGLYMMRVIYEWPITCEQNLTNTSINRRAFIGFCACSLATGCSEDITREAWHYLTEQQQFEANAMADKAIAEWESNHAKN